MLPMGKMCTRRANGLRESEEAADAVSAEGIGAAARVEGATEDIEAAPVLLLDVTIAGDGEGRGAGADDAEGT